uniref:Histone-lysine N-methyltransferase SETMAR n=1 Tax=Nippostrongylus brasiliensis TaxID=27835 RepID=A0A0N4XQR0_NIPBR
LFQIEEKARHLILKYSQDYVKDTARYRLVFPSRPSLGVSDYAPKHCPKQMCLCQFIDKVYFLNLYRAEIVIFLSLVDLSKDHGVTFTQ